MSAQDQSILKAIYSTIELDGLNRYDFRFYKLDDWDLVKMSYRKSPVCFILIRHIPGFVNHLNTYGFAKDISLLDIEQWLDPRFSPPVSLVGILILKGIDEKMLKNAIEQYRFKYCP